MDVPGVLLTATIWAYWIGVGAMIVRVRRHRAPGGRRGAASSGSSVHVADLGAAR